MGKVSTVQLLMLLRYKVSSTATEMTSSCFNLKREGWDSYLFLSFSFPKWLEVSVYVFEARSAI